MTWTEDIHRACIDGRKCFCDNRNDKRGKQVIQGGRISERKQRCVKCRLDGTDEISNAIRWNELELMGTVVVVVVGGVSKAVPAAVFMTDRWPLDCSGGLNSTPAPSHAGGTPRASGRTGILGGAGTVGRGVRGMDGPR